MFSLLRKKKAAAVSESVVEAIIGIHLEKGNSPYFLKQKGSSSVGFKKATLGGDVPICGNCKHSLRGAFFFGSQVIPEYGIPTVPGFPFESILKE